MKNETYERLVLASGNKTPAEISRDLDTTTANVGNWQARGVSKSGAINASTIYKVSLDWLLTGSGEMRPLQYDHYKVEEASKDETLKIPYMNARGSCGGGSYNDQTWVKGYMSKEASWFAKYRVKNTDLVAVYADGDSMADFIVDGDMVIFDTSKTTPIDGRIFAVEHPSGTKIKKLRQNFDGSWVLVSNNPDKRKYPDEPISAEDAEHMVIRGEFVYRQGG